jgi:hypothetical protein
VDNSSRDFGLAITDQTAKPRFDHVVLMPIYGHEVLAAMMLTPCHRRAAQRCGKIRDNANLASPADRSRDCPAPSMEGTASHDYLRRSPAREAPLCHRHGRHVAVVESPQ